RKRDPAPSCPARSASANSSPSWSPSGSSAPAPNRSSSGSRTSGRRGSRTRAPPAALLAMTPCCTPPLTTARSPPRPARTPPMSHSGPRDPSHRGRHRRFRARETGRPPGMHRTHRITVIGGGFAGLTAAITAAEAGAEVTVHEAHHTLGGRARTAEGPYRTNEGPHALYRGGPVPAPPPRAAWPTPAPGAAETAARRRGPGARRHRLPHLGHRHRRRGGRPGRRPLLRGRAVPPRPRLAVRRLRAGTAAPRHQAAPGGAV